MIVKLTISDSYTEEVYERLRLKNDKLHLKDDVVKRLDLMHVLYCKKKRKYFKHFQKDGRPIFTEDLDSAASMRLDDAYLSKRKIEEYSLAHQDKKYLTSITFADGIDKPMTLSVSQVSVSILN